MKQTRNWILFTESVRRGFLTFFAPITAAAKAMGRGIRTECRAIDADYQRRVAKRIRRAAQRKRQK